MPCPKPDSARFPKLAFRRAAACEIAACLCSADRRGVVPSPARPAALLQRGWTLGQPTELTQQSSAGPAD
eukprot:6160672-Alexandrium_andersonii.AAC.1